MPPDDKKSSIEQLKEDILAQLKVDANTFIESSDALAQYSNDVNKFFTQGRQRMLELQTSLADTTPAVARLGGGIGDVANIIGKVAEESRRNVIASTEEVEKLYAANQVLGLEADTLTKAFLDVGAGLETVGESLENSIEYVQSIGGNAKTVMKDVTNNMEQMNRFQFEGGVMGLTKMAAQASMLRFDMSQTFQLAEKVLSPEGAIETAAAFQRLGVAAGNLADPFALMNASINDPGALQDSLVDVAKQFTYFDEKTKTFKINPQGVLTLKEMQQQTGVSAAEMSKLGLAAAELDERISQISPSIKFENEEDKQYLANIGAMGEGGEYEVKIRNDEGIEQTRKLSELTQQEFNNLIKEQKERPKDLEDIARSQMSTSKLILNDVSAIRAKIVGGVVSAGQVLEAREKVREGVTTVSGALSEVGSAERVRQETQQAIGDIGTLIDDLKGEMDTTAAVSKYLESLGSQMGNIEKSFEDAIRETAAKIDQNSSDDSLIGKLRKTLEDDVTKEVVSSQTADKVTATSFIEGRQTQMQEMATAKTSTQNTTTKAQLDIGGIIKHEIVAPPGVSPEMLNKILSDVFTSDRFNSFLEQKYANFQGQGTNNFAPASTTY
jgi:hypothetical protein